MYYISLVYDLYLRIAKERVGNSDGNGERAVLL